MKILHITPEMLPAAWPHVQPHMEKANLRGNSRYPMQDYYADISQSRKQLYKLIDGTFFAWLIIGCVQTSVSRSCVVYALGGRGVLTMLADVVGVCEEFGRFNECHYITCSGRSGWVRELIKYGWNELNRTCGKEL